MSSQHGEESIVEGWHVEPDVHTTGLGLTGAFYDTVIQLFHKLVDHIQKLPTTPERVSKEIPQRYTHELQRFYLWGDGLSAADGHLDEILARSSELRVNVLSLLHQLSRVLTADFLRLHGLNDVEVQMAFNTELSEVKSMQERINTALHNSAPLFDLPGETESLSDSQISDCDDEDILDELSCYIDCLMDLCRALENPAMDVVEEDAIREEEAEVFNVSSPQALNYCRKVRDQYPTMSKALVERLGEANAARSTHLSELRRSSSRQIIAAPQEIPKKTDQISENPISEALFTKAESYPNPTDTTGSTFRSEPVFDTGQRSKTYTSPEQVVDDTISIASFESYSTTATALSQGRPRVPRLPKAARDGASFECPGCHTTLRGVTTRSAWKKHVFDDLRPFCCTAGDCQSSLELYSSTKQWVAHELQHFLQTPTFQESLGKPRNWPCPFCGPSSRNFVKQEYFKHVSKHLREVSLAALPHTFGEDEDPSSGSEMSSPVISHTFSGEGNDNSASGIPPAASQPILGVDTEHSEIIDSGDEITDSRDELHYNIRRSQSRRETSRWEPTDSKSLQEHLFDALEPIDDKDKDGFLPLSLLPLLLTEQSVFRELRKSLKQVCEPDEIADLARKVCSEEPAYGFEEAVKPKPKTYRKIFAILVLIEKTPAIRRFVLEGVNDSDLPFVRTRAGDGWTSFQIRSFEEWQWTTLAPFFARGEEREEVRHYLLYNQVILPFLSSNRREVLGGGGCVFKAIIHPDHHNFHAFLKCPRASPSDEDELPKCTCVFAIKCLRSQDRGSFKREVDMLRRFSNDAHPNLISLLATYEQNGNFFLVFPRAEADLQAYWEKIDPPVPMDADTVRWVAQQCLGIAKGVLSIHKYQSSNSRLQPVDPQQLFGNHGDIIPKNVLWFCDKDAEDGSGSGTLKLSDFGLADISSESSNFVTSDAMICSYRAPECDLPNQGGKGQQYDMWMLGCLYLEFVTWLVGGSALLDEFVRARLLVDIAWYEIKTDTFFQLEKEPGTGELYAIVKPSVTNFIARLRSDQRCTSFISDFLDLIQTGLLLVKSRQPRKDRLSIEQTHARLVDMVDKCKDWDYCCKQHHPSKAQIAVRGV